MIRFNCSNCGREYHLPDALARMPLLCKGCGHRLDVPDPTPDAEPEPPVPAPAGTPDPDPPAAVPPDGGSPPDGVELSPEPDAEPSPAGEPEQPASPVTRDAGAVVAASDAAGRGRVLARVADVAVGLLLAGVGAMLGEFATRKGTVEILREAGSAPKFPPVDLLLWLGCVATPVLGYVLLAKRGKSVGAWLRGRLGA